MDFAAFASSSFYENPYRVYDQIRSRGPVVKVGNRLWATCRYDVANSLLCDRRIGRNYMSSIVARYGEEKAKAPIFQTLSRIMLLMNPPTHTRLRSLSMKVFTAAQVAQTAEFAQASANWLIAAMQQKRSAEIMSEFAIPLPAMVICTLLGVPLEHVDLFTQAVADAAVSVETAPLNDDQIATASKAIGFMQDYFSDLMAERRRNLGTDLVSLLLKAEEGDDRLSEEEVLANVILLFMAGHETTTNMIGNSLIGLHRHPAQLDKLLTDPSLMPKAVAECLRYDTSAQVTSRATMEDMEIEGVAVPKDNTIFIFLGGANRDPAKFEDADQIIIGRPDQGSRMISFGGGIHYCLGARLAAVELEVALTALFKQMPAFRISNLDAIEYHPRNALRGPKAVHIAW